MADDKIDSLSFSEWFSKNNPFYLISVFMMFLGLWLISSESSATNSSLYTVISFFGIQNLYEIIIISMGLFLVRKNVNSRHGLMLLCFLPLFLTDMTFFQARVSSLSQTAGLTVSTVYLILAGVKVFLIMKFLEIKLEWDRLVYIFTSLALIYFGPIYIYYTLEKSAGHDIMVWQANNIYALWLISAIAAIPFVVKNFKKSTVDKTIENSYLSDSNTFYRYTMKFIFFMTFVQMMVNTTSTGLFRESGSILHNIIPVLTVGLFFVEAFIRRQLETESEINTLDITVLTAALIMCFSETVKLLPEIYYINLTIVYSALIICFIFRKNYYSLAIISLSAGYYIFGKTVAVLQNVLAAGRELSRTGWAIMLTVFSFVFLIVGFIFSMKSSKKGI
ncbi:MAG: hypothetical protein HQM10_17225 [Candidatus Riflebacteria bacterium]|nr:hypothetical protein [Candidatus Riflebacteria bacterium]